MGRTVRLAVVGDEAEAELLCGLLRANGIGCGYRTSDLEIGGCVAGGYTFGGWREILVDEDDLTRARRLLPETSGQAREVSGLGDSSTSTTQRVLLVLWALMATLGVRPRRAPVARGLEHDLAAGRE